MRESATPAARQKRAASAWLTVSEASGFLLVSPSTLRRWTAKRLIPVQRTVGGHRRYSREVIEGLARSTGLAGGSAAAPTPPAFQGEWGVSQRRLREERWYSTIARTENLTSMRILGQRLPGLLIQHVSRPQGDRRFLGEAREVGVLYGRQCAGSKATLQETLDAFLFFRKSFSRTVFQLPGMAHSSDAGEVVRLTQLTDSFMDEVLSGIAEGYESSSPALAQAGPESRAADR